MSKPAPETGFLDRVITVDGVARAYQVFVPRGYTAARRWPVILFLHGSGERGADGLLPTAGALGEAIRRHADRFPALVVFPQCACDRLWNGDQARFAMAALEQTEQEFATDPQLVYLTGLSLGGAGSYYLAYRNPERFAAVLVNCGRVTPFVTVDGKPVPADDPVVPQADGEPFAALAVRLAKVPLWLFHGDADQSVSVEESRRLADALRDAGAKFTYTELAGVAHNCWDTAYRDAEVARWLFDQQLIHP